MSRCRRDRNLSAAFTAAFAVTMLATLLVASSARASVPSRPPTCTTKRVVLAPAGVWYSTV